MVGNLEEAKRLASVLSDRQEPGEAAAAYALIAIVERLDALIKQQHQPRQASTTDQ